MKQILAAIMLLALAPVAQARPIDRQAELDRSRCESKWSHCCWQAKACLPSRAPARRHAAAFGLSGGR
jgi:hypothetical protein